MKQFEPIDIHFVSWNRPKITELAIKTIVRNTKPDNYRLVVLDNGSSFEQVKMLEDLQNNGYIDELVLFSENRGLEAARDHMLRNCVQGEFFICADNDCLPEPIDKNNGDWVEKLYMLMRLEPRYAAISCRTQVMIGSGNIFDQHEEDLIVDFPHPGGSLRIMRTQPTKDVGGWEGKPGRGAEERWICGLLREAGWLTGFAVQVPTLHLFGLLDSDRWGYDKDLKPEDTGHSDIWHPVLASGDDLAEVEKYAGKELTNDYSNNQG